MQLATTRVGWLLIAWALTSPVLAQNVDALGDPLPPHAIARLGTSRLRSGGPYESHLEFHPDNKRMLTGNHLWDETGKLIRSFAFVTGQESGVSISRKGDRLALRDFHTGIGIYDIESSRPLHILQFSRGNWARTADFSPAGDSLLLAHYGGPLTLWAIGESCTQTWKRDGKYQGAMFSPDGTWIAAWYGVTIERIDGRTGTLLSSIVHNDQVDTKEENRNEIMDVHISPDGTMLASSGEEGTFVVWKAETGTPILRVVDAHRFGTYGAIYSVRFSPDSKTLATCGSDRIVRFWDLESKRQTHTIEQERSRRVRFSSDGKRVALSDYGIHICDTATGKPVIDLPGHGDRAQKLTFFDGGNRLVSLGYNCSDVCVWIPRTGEQLRRIHEPAVHSVEVLADGPWAVVGGHGRLSLYDLLAGRRVVLAETRDAQLSRYYSHLSVSADGGRLATSYGNRWRVIRTVPKDPSSVSQSFTEFWDLTDGAGGKSTAVAVEERPEWGRLTADGKSYVSIQSGKLKIQPFENVDEATRTLWNVEQSEDASRSVRAFVVSPDSSCVAIACGRGGAYVVDLKTGARRHHWQPPDAYFSTLEFSRDGRYVVAGRRHFYIYDVRTGQLRQKIVLPPGTSHDCAELSPDNSLLATGDRDGNVNLWDVDSGKYKVAFRGHVGDVRDLEFSPDGKLLASCADDSTILVWNTDLTRLPKEQEQNAEIDALWKRMGEFDAAIAYDAVRQLIDRPDEARALLQRKIDTDIELPTAWQLQDEADLRIWRAAYVLEQLPGDEARKLRSRIRRPHPTDGHNPFGEEPPGNRVIDGERVTSASGNVSVQRLNHQLCLHDPTTGDPRKTLPIAGQPLKLSNDGRFLILSMDDERSVAAVELATATQLWRNRASLRRALTTLHSDGRHFMIANSFPQDGIQTWDVLTGEITGSWVMKDRTRNLRSADGRWSVSLRSRDMLVYDSNRKKLWSAPVPSANGICEFVRNNLLAVSSDNRKQIALHRVDDGTIVDTISIKDVTLYALSPFLQTAVGKDSEGALHLYELSSGKSVQRISAENAIDAAYDGNRLLTLDDQKATRVWELNAAQTTRGADESDELFLKRLATDFYGDDSVKSYRSALGLIAAGNAGVTALKAQAPTVSTKKVEQLIDQLNADDFPVREQATRKLIDVGPVALRVLASSPLLESSPEVKQRAKTIISAIDNGRSPSLNRLRWVLARQRRRPWRSS